MKKSIFLTVLLGIALCAGLAAQEAGSTVYHLVVIDRAKCPGETVKIDEALAVFAHGETGFYIVFGKGLVTVPSGAVVVADMTAQKASVISRYLDEPSFRRFVSTSKILEGLKFAIKAAGK